MTTGLNQLDPMPIPPDRRSLILRDGRLRKEKGDCDKRYGDSSRQHSSSFSTECYEQIGSNSSWMYSRQRVELGRGLTGV